MKYFLVSLIFLLVLVSCEKEEESPIRVVFELGKCFNGTVSGNFTVEQDASNFDENLSCGQVFSDTHFPLSEEACSWLLNYCCEEDKEVQFINSDGDNSFLFIDERKPVLMNAPIEVPCENQSDKKLTYYHYFEIATVRLGTSLSDEMLSLEVWPDRENILSDAPKLGAYMDINIYESSFLGHNNTDRSNSNEIYYPRFTIPIDRANLSLPFRYDFQYLPEIEILGKTFYKVYTHEEELEGFYTKIYYNKEFGIVSFVDETGEQWRLDL